MSLKRGRYINFNTRQRLLKVAKLYAQMLLNNNVDYNILYITAYDSDSNKPVIAIPSPQQLLVRVKRILNNRRLQEMLADELLKMMNKNGFSIADAIKYRKQILVGAIDKKQYAIANKTLDSFDNKLGISDNQLTQPLLNPSNGAMNFDHLTKVKEVNYKEIKQLRDDNKEEVATNQPQPS